MTVARIVLWTGPKHSGKTTAAMQLAREVRRLGFSVAGLAAPSVYEGSRLVGFDLLDLETSSRTTFARRGIPGQQEIGPFGITADGLAFGCEVLSRPTTRAAHLVIVDEFGPLELAGRGWRNAVDELTRLAAGVILLVVRDSISDEVAKLYRQSQPTVINAGRNSRCVNATLELVDRLTG